VIGIQRVFENLVDNALKYGERAQVRLFQEGGEVVAEIADEGPGLPDAELEQLFRPFYRGAVARESGKRGIGLGLAVSRSTVRAHGGELNLSCVPGGLVAQVRLPLTRPIAVAA
jgi:two-component system OmpR family sensor kinase